MRPYKSMSTPGIKELISCVVKVTASHKTPNAPKITMGPIFPLRFLGSERLGVLWPIFPTHLLRALYYLAAISLPQIIRALKDGWEEIEEEDH